MTDATVKDLISFLQYDEEQKLYGEDEDTIALYSYRNWALSEALKRIVDRPFVSCEDVLFDFMLELNCYSKSYARDPTNSGRLNPFSIACDQIETILAMAEAPAE